MFLQPNLRLSPTVLVTTIAALTARPEMSKQPAAAPHAVTSTQTKVGQSTES